MRLPDSIRFIIALGILFVIAGADWLAGQIAARLRRFYRAILRRLG